MKWIWLVLCWASVATAQVEHRGVHYKLDLPADWRQMTPDEARQLRNHPGTKLPARLTQVTSPDQHAFGAIDRWLKQDYDGRALFIHSRTEELPGDEQGLAKLRQQWLDDAKSGTPVQILEMRAIAHGKSQHPALEAVLEFRWPNEVPTRAIQIYGQSGRRTWMFHLEATAEDFPAAQPQFTQILASLSFAQAPVKASSSWLGTALTSLFVVVVLLLLSSLVRRRNIAS